MTTASAVLQLVIPGPIRPKERPRLGRRGGTYTPPRTRAYEAMVRTIGLAAVARARWAWSASGYSVALHVFAQDRRRRDLDNIAKICLDPLNGVAFEDDSEVDELHVYRHLDRARPRVEITVSPIETACQ